MEPLYILAILFLAGSLVMVVTWFVLFFHSRRGHLREWLISWVITFIAHVFYERLIMTEVGIYGIVFGVLILLASFFFLRGVYTLFERRSPSHWLVAVPLTGLLATFIALFAAPLTVYQFLVFIFSGIPYVLSGVYIIQRRERRLTSTGFVFLVFGVLLAFAPMIALVEIYMPYGLFVLMTFGMLTAAGSIFLHYNTLHAAAQKEKKRLERLGYHDPLTGLANRARMMEKRTYFSDREHFPVSVVFIDVNNLKEVNDTRGHQHGDALLKQLAAILTALHRENDVHVRYGGDEFILLLPSTSEEEAVGLMDDILDQCRIVDLEDIPLTISAGHATQREEGESFDEVFVRAEKSMYKDKATSKPT